MAQAEDPTSGAGESAHQASRPCVRRALASAVGSHRKGLYFRRARWKAQLVGPVPGRSQLYIKHFLMAPGAEHQCVGCSLEDDHMTDILPHLENHDLSYAVMGRAPIEEIEVVRKRMGWKFLWVIPFSNHYNYDFSASFR